MAASPEEQGVDTADPEAFDHAVQAFRDRVPLTDSEWDELTDRLRERAFKVSGVAQADVVQQVYDALDSALEQGTDFDDFKESVKDALESSWGGEIPGRIETIFRTNVQTAYSHGRVRQMRTVKKHRPLARLDGVADDRQTEICERVDGLIMKLDDFEAQNLVPPLHFNCRTILTPIDEEDVDEDEIADGADYEADDDFGAPPSDRDEWDVDINGYAPEITEILAARLDEE